MVAEIVAISDVDFITYKAQRGQNISLILLTGSNNQFQNYEARISNQMFLGDISNKK